MLVRSRRAHFLVALAALFALGASLAPLEARAEGDPYPTPRYEGNELFDMVVLRPTGLLRTVIGAAILIPAYPLSLASGDSNEILDRCVRDPARDTFTRPLGDY